MFFKVGLCTPTSCFPCYSWLHHSDATVGHIGALEPSDAKGEEESSNKLLVHAILSEATRGKFVAKYGRSVALTETQGY